MTSVSRETIFAQATASGRAGVSIIRISGPQAHEAVQALCGDVPTVRKASLRKIKDRSGALIDEALILTFDQDASFTGEESAELQLHGSVAIMKSVLRELSLIEGLRMAEAGEFTRRALENERLDLSQVEGLSDLIESETEAQRRQAMKVFSGGLREITDIWRADLIRACALIEATIDFADEEVPVDVSPEVIQLIEKTQSSLQKEVTGMKVSERIRDGFEVAIIGAPNVGKSTLLNALAGREAAITSEIEGTTRDVLEVHMDLSGLPVTVLDTAGLRETEDQIEAIGIERAKARAAQADIRVFLKSSDNTILDIEPASDDIILYAKDDVGEMAEGTSISGKSGHGVAELIERISKTLSNRAAGSSTATHERHRIAIQNSLLGLEDATQELLQNEPLAEFVANNLYRAIKELDSLVGRVDVESVLGEIFSSFCIGK